MAGGCSGANSPTSWDWGAADRTHGRCPGGVQASSPGGLTTDPQTSAAKTCFSQPELPAGRLKAARGLLLAPAETGCLATGYPGAWHPELSLGPSTHQPAGPPRAGASRRGSHTRRDGCSALPTGCEQVCQTRASDRNRDRDSRVAASGAPTPVPQLTRVTSGGCALQQAGGRGKNSNTVPGRVSPRGWRCLKSDFFSVHPTEERPWEGGWRGKPGGRPGHPGHPPHPGARIYRDSRPQAGGLAAGAGAQKEPREKIRDQLVWRKGVWLDLWERAKCGGL